MVETKYGKHLYKHPIESLGKLSSGMDRTYVGFERKKDFDSNMTVIYLYAREPDPPVETHTHDYDEYLSFIGLDPDDPGYLGAECPILLGEEQEEHVFSTPTTIYIPKGLPHGYPPMRRFDKPFLIVHMFLTPNRPKIT